jgi:hypothetical protein
MKTGTLTRGGNEMTAADEGGSQPAGDHGRGIQAEGHSDEDQR